MRVKVCGLTSYEDAACALDQGADALGFNFYPRSPRYIAPAEARAIVRRLPPFVTTVGVFVNASSSDELAAAAHCAGVQVLQLHGDESPDYCRQLSDWILIKAIRIGQNLAPEPLADYPAHAFLLDAKDDVLFGGTGKSFDWSLAAGIKKLCPIILAGGLNATNVADAIRAVQPYAVDVCSGVESEPGKKDPAKLRDFMSEVRNVIQNR